MVLISSDHINESCWICLFLRGLYIAVTLIKSAKLIESSSYLKVLTKNGDMKKAEKDFELLRPTNVKNVGVGVAYFSVPSIIEGIVYIQRKIQACFSGSGRDLPSVMQSSNKMF